MPPVAGWWSGTLEWLNLLGSVIRIVFSPRWHRGAVKGSLLSRIDGHIGVPRAVLQPYAASAAAAFGLARDDFVPLRRANFPVSRPGTFVPRLDWFCEEGATPSAAPIEAKLKANPGDKGSCHVELGRHF